MRKIIGLLLVLILITGCQVTPDEIVSEIDNNQQDLVVEIDETIDEKPEEIVIEPDQEVSEINEPVEPEKAIIEEVISPLDAYISQMTLEEKVGQLFVVDLYTLNGLSETSVMTDYMRSQIETYHIGGVIFFGPNIETVEQTTALINTLQEVSTTPLFISVDEEGGIVRRIGHNDAMGMTYVPTASDIGSSGDLEAAYNYALGMGGEMNSFGFNMDFAPIADVNTNPDNPIIGKRAFGDDPQLVGEMVVAFASGLQDAGIIATAKHFPGHGDTAFDTHTGDVYVEHNKERLDEIELVPFQMAIDSGIDCIMTAHIVLEQVTGHTNPATFSPELLEDVLRDEMAYEGLLITDALNMDAISKRYEMSEIGVKAFEAGNDLLLMPESIDEIYNGLLEAFRDGSLDEEVLNVRVKRILSYKEKYSIIEINK